MQKYLGRIFVCVALIFATSFSASAQIFVKIRPAHERVVRTVAPGPGYVWVDEEWEPRGGTYVYTGGRWVAPPHPGFIWVPGHWRRHGRDGEWWVAGHWRRR